MKKSPNEADFPPGTEFIIKDFDVPLTRVSGGGHSKWLNWYGGIPRPYAVANLKAGNNWPASSFAEWIALVEASTAE